MGTSELPTAERLWLAEEEAADLERKAEAARAMLDAKRAEVDRLRAEAGLPPRFAACPHRQTAPDPEFPDEYLVCRSCGATGSVEPCGICSQQFCMCREWNLR